MIIGIGGYKNVGKNTAAKAFTKQGFIELPFAGTLKRICSDLYGVSYELFDKNELKDEPYRFYDYSGIELGSKVIQYFSLFGTMRLQSELDIRKACLAKQFKTPRQILQFIGTDLGRECVGSLFWVDVFEAEIQKQLGLGKNVVVPDIRFPNERQCVAKLGGKLLLIERPLHGPSGHSSETQIGTEADYDRTFSNHLSEGHLIAQVESWYEQVQREE